MPEIVASPSSSGWRVRVWLSIGVTALTVPFAYLVTQTVLRGPVMALATAGISSVVGLAVLALTASQGRHRRTNPASLEAMFAKRDAFLASERSGR